MPGPLELILILLVIALLFGSKKLPDLMKGAGQGIREFRKEVQADAGTPHRETPPRETVTDVPSQQLDPVTGQPMQPAETSAPRQR